MPTLYRIVWEFRVKPDCLDTFENLYGPKGNWAELFRKGPGYHDTGLWKDTSQPGRYLVIDTWTSETAYLSFRQEFADEYKALDKQGEELTLAETDLGRFTG